MAGDLPDLEQLFLPWVAHIFHRLPALGPSSGKFCRGPVDEVK